MRASRVEVTAVNAHDPVACVCLDRYFDELAARFPEGYLRADDGAADVADFNPPAGVFLVAEILGEPAGCGALRTFSPGIGEIKRMWVSPEVRGLGMGRRLLESLEDEARERKLHRVRLDTHSSLVQALQLYRTAGYRDIARYNDNPYAHHWLEKPLG
ncbi:MAG TPA: GNAT family N-acetyltransferase [Steroidobacteraceae bacterium]|jgi:GNAT superfamily N-acetyltransferase|nr:GNAT family N-acetyltransferase [Steroidobacteraceae bacterium]